MIRAWTLIPLSLAQTGDAMGKLFGDWRELAAMVLLGVGFIILVGTIGAMWRTRWRPPSRESSNSRLDQLTSLEREYMSASADAPPARSDEALAAMGIAEQPPETITPRPAPERSREPARVEVPMAAVRSAPSTAVPTIAEAQQLLQTMNAAEDLTTRLNAEVQEKVRTLSELIATADAKIAELERLSRLPAPVPHSGFEDQPPLAPVVTLNRLSPSMAATAAAIHTPSTPRPTTVAAPTSHARLETPRPAPAVSPLTQGARSAEPQTRPVHAVPTLVANDPTGPDPLTGEIYRLADQGMPAIEISRRLNQHVGKVELILALRPG